MKNKIFKACMVLFGTAMIVISLFLGIGAIAEMTDESGMEEALTAFDPTYNSGLKEYVKFDMITYPFAGFELNDTQGFYFVLDDMLPYIVCMEDSKLETEFKEIYDYTFSDSTTQPQKGYLEGYAVEIDDGLKAFAIEEFNYLWDEEIVTEENFADYFGSYYLDTIYVPDEAKDDAEMLVISLIGIAIGIFTLYATLKKKKVFPKQGNVMGAAQANADAMHMAGDLPVQGNIILAIVASFVGAAAGGLLWIVMYKLGYVAAVTGFVGAYGAIWCWTKVGKRELNIPAIVWCVIVAAVMLVLGNYVVYAWEVTDAINASSPGRAEFGKVLQNMPQIMEEWELWGSFASDLGMGLVLAVVSGVVGLFGKKNRA